MSSLYAVDYNSQREEAGYPEVPTSWSDEAFINLNAALAYVNLYLPRYALKGSLDQYCKTKKVGTYGIV